MSDAHPNARDLGTVTEKKIMVPLREWREMVDGIVELTDAVETMRARMEEQNLLLDHYKDALTQIVEQVGPAVEMIQNSPVLRTVLGVKKPQKGRDDG